MPSGIPIRLYVTAGRRTISLDLEDYLVGVVAAEMPANFEIEALKAQAVAARTFTVKRLKRFGGAGSRLYPKADLSDNPSDGQAWMSEDSMKKKWGVLGCTRNLARIRRAVSETRGLILTYQGRPAEAIYHSTCGGRTEDAREVWGKSLPYLRGVPCGFDNHSPRYRQTYRLSLSQVAKTMGSQHGPQARTVTTSKTAFGVVGQTATGRARYVSLSGVLYEGERFRQAFGLNSPRFRFAVSGNNLVLTTIGYGHGVGLCQYGADGMSKAGRKFHQVLAYYYPGTELARIVKESPK